MTEGKKLLAQKSNVLPESQKYLECEVLKVIKGYLKVQWENGTTQWFSESDFFNKYEIVTNL